MENNELKQPLINEQSNSCCYFDIFCGELCYYICTGVVYLLGYLFKNNLN